MSVTSLTSHLEGLTPVVELSDPWSSHSHGENSCEPSHLCDTCKQIFHKNKFSRGPFAIWWKRSRSFRYHATIQQLEAAVALKCHFCSIVLAEIRNQVKASPCSTCALELQVVWTCGTMANIWIGITSSGTCTHSDGHAGKAIQGTRRWGNLSNYCANPDLSTISLPCSILIGASQKPVYHPAMTCMSTSSSAHLDLAHYWMSECAVKHHICDQNRTIRMPKRLLAVHDSLQTRTVKVVEGCGTVLYFALSHCWGGIQTITQLTSATRETLMRGFPLDDLPQSFQDAVSITQRLGIDYLWIDSLCIVQDDKQDWWEESEIMGEIYKNSAVTIAASGACNPHTGLYRERNPLEYSPCLIAADQNEEICIQREASLQEGSSLDSRGWCFQEYLLSPRILYFGEKRMHWRCRAGVAHEDVPKGKGVHASDMAEIVLKSRMGEIMIDKFKSATSQEKLIAEVKAEVFEKVLFPDSAGEWLSLVLDQKEIFGKDTKDVKEGHVDLLETSGRTELAILDNWGRKILLRDDPHSYGFHRLWFGLVSRYSTRRLTRGEDKLAAVSGIVYDIQRRMPYQYLAGLWEPSLRFDLMWFARSPAAERPTNLRAPSWSWASVDATISTWLAAGYDRDTLSPQCELMSGSTSEDLVMGVLGFQGVIKSAKISSQGDEISHDDWEKRSNMSGPLLSVNTPLVPDICDSGQRLGTLRLDTIKFDPANVWLMPVFKATRKAKFFDSLPPWAQWKVRDPVLENTQHTICGLALEATGHLDVNPGSFKRIGIFHFDFNEWDSVQGKWFDDCTRQRIMIE